MVDFWEKTLKKINQIEGLLVPGQERVLYDAATQLKKGSTVVEIGSFQGRSTACLALGRRSEDIKIYAIDTFAGNEKDFIRGKQFKHKQFLTKFEKNMSKLNLKNVIPIQGYSQEVGKKWNKPIDLLFIDGSHIYEDVKRDFELFYPWVKPGGIVLLHDVDPAFPGVYKVWHEVVKNKLSQLGNWRTLSFGRKPRMYEVFIVLPVHNRLKYTKRCLNSLEKQGYKNYEVIVVDDGSSDGTVEYLKERYDWTTISGNGKWWWTKSVNRGIKEALKKAKKGDFILTMNNDCYFKANYLTNIIRASQNNKRAIVGSLILDADRHTRVVDAGVKIVWKHNLIYGIADKISRDLKFYRDREIIKNIDTLPGKGTLIPIEVFDKIGNFNYRRLPHYIADYEFFCRAKRNGFKLIVSSKARIYNFFQATGVSSIDGKPNPKKILYLLFGRKSKLNIVDYVNFLLLCCPKKYLYRNLVKTINRGVGYVLLFGRIRLFLHNFPILVKQHSMVSRTRLFFHNLPIYLRQHRIMFKIRLFVHKMIIKVKHCFDQHC